MKYVKAFFKVIGVLSAGVLTMGAIYAAFHFAIVLYPHYTIPTLLVIVIGSLTYAVAQES